MRTKAKLGQNFLTDENAARKIVAAAGDIASSLVIEIGPGTGVLTGLLAERAGKVIAIEVDRILATQLRMAYSKTPNVEVIEADVRNVDFYTLVRGDIKGTTDRQTAPAPKARVVGNLPYYITSDILLRLFAFHDAFDYIVIMVQREVADRIAAEPGSRDYGLLTVTTQLYCDVQTLFTMPPSAFSPPPKVHSTVLRLRVQPKAAALEIEEKDFIRFLKIAFAQKRKTLLNNLKQSYSEESSRLALKATVLRPDIRAEAVSLQKFAALWKHLHSG